MFFKIILIHFSLLLGTTNVYAQKKKSNTQVSQKKTSVEAKSYHDLSIMWEANQVSEKEKKDWKKACSTLAKNLKLDAKSSSQGVFRKVKCLGIVNKVDFKKVPTNWTLVMDSREDVKFDIYYKHSKKSKDIKQSAHIEFGATPKLIEALKDPQVSLLIAASLRSVTF